MASANPLLELTSLPPFTAITPEHIEPAITQILTENRESLAALLAKQPSTWAELMPTLDSMDQRLSEAWSPISHLHSVMNSDALREAYNACLPALSEYYTELGQHGELFACFQRVANEDGLDSAQKQALKNSLRSFELSGIGLPDDKKQAFAKISQELSELQAKFEQNLMDASQSWVHPIDSEDQLQGMTATGLALAKQAAQEKETGTAFALTLEYPVYSAVVTYADNRELRKAIYTAFSTRASDQGPDAGTWDNSSIMHRIVELRLEKAKLLGFAHYADLSIYSKMAESVDEVENFLRDLVTRCKNVASDELAELKAMAVADGIDDFSAWDVAYYSEKLMQQKHQIDSEELRQYFVAEDTLAGLLDITSAVFGLQFKQRHDVVVYHEDVVFYDVLDDAGNLRGQFYLDLYARANKRGGAWMDVCRERRINGDHSRVPVAYLTCNASPATETLPALFSHSDVETLFHEFGHGLHHMLTLVDYPDVAGINGVEWDAVELPSQFLENFCWEYDALSRFAKHYDTGKPLPRELFDRLNGTRAFQAGLAMLRQTEFALFDLLLYRCNSMENVDIQGILDDVRRDVAVMQPPASNRFQHSFSHIFAGGYAAGYYSYKWAEVLAADAFAKFSENGVFDTQTGREFRQEILEVGGSRPALDSFTAFRGRKPTIDALLAQSGLA